MIFDNIKKILEEKGMSVTDFETKLGLSKGGFYKWKNHSPSIAIAKKAADILDVPLQEIL